MKEANTCNIPQQQFWFAMVHGTVGRPNARCMNRDVTGAGREPAYGIFGGSTVTLVRQWKDLALDVFYLVEYASLQGLEYHRPAGV